MIQNKATTSLFIYFNTARYSLDNGRVTSILCIEEIFIVY